MNKINVEKKEFQAGKKRCIPDCADGLTSGEHRWCLNHAVTKITAVFSRETLELTK